MKKTPIVKQSKIRITDKISLDGSESGLSTNKYEENATKSPNSSNMTESIHLIDSKTEVLDGFNMIKEMYDNVQNQPMLVDELADELMEPRPSEEILVDLNGLRPCSSASNEKSKIKFVEEQSRPSSSTSNKIDECKKTMETQSDSDVVADDDDELTAVYKTLVKKNVKENSKSSDVAIKDSPRVTRKSNFKPNYNLPFNIEQNVQSPGVFGGNIIRVTPRRKCRTDSEIEKERKKNLWDSDSDEYIPVAKKKTRMTLKLAQPELPEDYDDVKRSYGLGGFNKMNNEKIGILQIYGRDFNSLRGSQFLNDVIIDKYLELLCRRNDSNPNYRKCAALSVFFPCSLERGNMKSSLAFFPENTFENELLFIPTNDDNHWYLFVADFVNLSLFYYDSLIGISKEIERRNKRRKIFEALQAFSKNHNKELDWHEWKDVPAPNQTGPVQTNGSDCGVYVLQYADRISRNVDTLMTDEQMKTYRQRMIYELLKGELLPPSPY